MWSSMLNELRDSDEVLVYRDGEGHLVSLELLSEWVIGERGGCVLVSEGNATGTGIDVTAVVLDGWTGKEMERKGYCDVEGGLIRVNVSGVWRGRFEVVGSGSAGEVLSLRVNGVEVVEGTKVEDGIWTCEVVLNLNRFDEVGVYIVGVGAGTWTMESGRLSLWRH